MFRKKEGIALFVFIVQSTAQYQMWIFMQLSHAEQLKAFLRVCWVHVLETKCQMICMTVNTFQCQKLKLIIFVGD